MNETTWAIITLKNRIILIAGYNSISARSTVTTCRKGRSLCRERRSGVAA
ncbi:MAG: hypothetical protein MZV63_70125 [Marinilabiliales bacterium]|nr:hypothetical protein [Marinilabiliales bacterium]